MCDPVTEFLSFENESSGILALRILLLTFELPGALSLLVRLAAARLAMRDLKAGRQPTITAGCENH